MTLSLRIIEAAVRHSLDPILVEAVVQIESGGNPFAWNPEPQYRYLWDVRRRAPFRPLTDEERASEHPPADFPRLAGDADQEWWGQQASWGLMQVMGAVARELGFRGPYLTELVDPETNLHFGCMKLRQLMAWADHDVERALAAYNGGPSGNTRRPLRNAEYAAKVLGVFRKLEGAIA